MGAQLEEHGMIIKGAFTYGDPGVLFPEGNDVEIGKFCSIAGGVQFFAGGDHRVDWITTHPLGHMGLGGRLEGTVRQGRKTIVGNDVWIGSHVVIMSGSVVGDGAVIGAYSVVRGTFPPYSLIYGNPATIQRMRFPDEDIQRLLEIAWWDWSVEEVKEVSLILQSDDLKALYEYAERRPRENKHHHPGT